MSFDKYLFALGRGVRGARQAFETASQPPDAALQARDVTPAPVAPTPPPLPPVADDAPPRSPRALVFGGRPLVMGIVNVTPDSFSDGGDFLDPDAAVRHALQLVAEGADILDIGGESTRPGAAPVDEEDEMARVLPVIRALARATDVPISIDTMKADVAEAAIAAGATLVNDVWGFQRDPRMAAVVAAAGVPVILMHNREHDDPSVSMLAEVLAFLERSIAVAVGAGVSRDKIIIDPGFGFGKTHDQSLALLRDFRRLQRFGLPILLGVSRKRFIGRVIGREAPRARSAGSVAAAVIGAMAGAAIVRVHDVAAHLDAMKVVAAVRETQGARP